MRRSVYMVGQLGILCVLLMVMVVLLFVTGCAPEVGVQTESWEENWESTESHEPELTTTAEAVDDPGTVTETNVVDTNETEEDGSSEASQEDPAKYLNGNWDGSYYLHSVTEDGIWLESTEENRYYNELQKYGKLWIPFVKEEVHGYDPVFFSGEIEPTLPVSIICTYEEFLQSWTPERKYIVYFGGRSGELAVDHIEPVEKCDDGFGVWDGLIYRINQTGDQLELMRVEYIHKTDTERIEELRQTEGLELTEEDFGEFFGYYTKYYDEEIRTVYLQDNTCYYYMDPNGTMRVSLEEMNFYKSESQFIGDYRVLLDGDKVVWIAEHGLP